MKTAHKVSWLLAVGMGCCMAQSPQSSSTSGPDYVAARGPSLALAREAAQAAIDRCKALHANVAVSVVDSAGILKLLVASDGTFAKGVTSSTAKAVTARDFGMPINELAEKIKTDPALAERVKSNPSYVVGAGGIPLRVGSDVIGAIGVGGAIAGGRDPAYPDKSAPNRDELCARAAADRISSRLK
jgi:uncharacterized protein GlcG (DUF336 family)